MSDLIERFRGINKAITECADDDGSINPMIAMHLPVLINELGNDVADALAAAEQRIEELDAALNVAANGLTELSRGYDLAGTELDKERYARGLLDHVCDLWKQGQGE
ncbi:MAG: hypothetical protein OEQ39_04140 [Gammaproteobacteria bacterium]|nr:hypothetical protein [Gammaproteobacteria bacterium]MDH3466198.1 hypothetical protein [Gammaproteobacteria bacterium]